MTYDEVRDFYPTIIKISNIIYKNNGRLQISGSNFIIGKGYEDAIITPQEDDSTLTLKCSDNLYLNNVKLSEIDADDWFNLSISAPVPFGYDCIEKMRELDKNFHILVGFKYGL